METMNDWTYEELRSVSEEVELPAMFVNLDRLEANVDRFRRLVTDHDKTLRVASKSVRVPALLHYILDRGGDWFEGLMCFSPREASVLREEGFEDLLVAYPRVQKQTLSPLCTCWNEEEGRGVVMVDEPTHLDVLETFLDEESSLNTERIPVCIDVDMSNRLPGLFHLGVQRSPIRSAEQFRALVRRIQSHSSLELVGVMGYEAQVAGGPDRDPFHVLQSLGLWLLRPFFQRSVAEKRRKMAAVLEEEKVEIDIFNGGGTGSIQSTVRDESVTEVTAGSGFLQSHIFDYYRDNENLPAACFGLPVTRVPEPGIVTCQSGGFIASGPVGRDKAPVPFRPEAMSTLGMEGFGEVQTPLHNESEVELEPRDPVFFRPAKAGEVAEHFQEYVLVRDGEIVDRVPTYRGMGYRFF